MNEKHLKALQAHLARSDALGAMVVASDFHIVVEGYDCVELLARGMPVPYPGCNSGELIMMETEAFHAHGFVTDAIGKSLKATVCWGTDQKAFALNGFRVLGAKAKADWERRSDLLAVFVQVEWDSAEPIT